MKGQRLEAMDREPVWVELLAQQRQTLELNQFQKPRARVVACQETLETQNTRTGPPLPKILHS